MKWAAMMYYPIGMKVGQFRDTKAEAEQGAVEWKQHIVTLKRKPRGEIYVISERKYEAMLMSCGVHPDDPDDDPEIIRLAEKAKRSWPE